MNSSCQTPNQTQRLRSFTQYEAKEKENGRRGGLSEKIKSFLPLRFSLFGEKTTKKKP